MKTQEPVDKLGSAIGSIQSNGYTSAVIYQNCSDRTQCIDWLVQYHQQIRAILRGYGFLMLRGFYVDIDIFGRIARVLGGEMLEYTERSTPRTAVSERVYTSTDYPSDRSIPMHNESSYSDKWPETLFFFCHTPPMTGGRTPIADSRAVLHLIPTAIRARFAGGVVYSRYFRKGLGLSWEEAFQTNDRRVVEDYCNQHRIQFTWTDNGLRTVHRRPSTQRIPDTGEEVWFNQANLFHISALPTKIRETLLSRFASEDLPRNAYLGDGSAIPEEYIMEISLAYEKASLALDWQASDIMVLNNMLMAHGREPYGGNRQILVAMT